MKNYTIYIMLLVFLILVSGCVSDPISSNDLDQKNLVLSSKLLTLELGQEKDFFMGINNKDTNSRKFDIFISCKNCEDNVVVQFFPSIEIDAGSKGAFPILLKTSESAKEGNYKFYISVNHKDNLIAEESFSVQVIDSVKIKKATLLN
jgi:hypothetical protein